MRPDQPTFEVAWAAIEAGRPKDATVSIRSSRGGWCEADCTTYRDTDDGYVTRKWSASGGQITAVVWDLARQLPGQKPPNRWWRWVHPQAFWTFAGLAAGYWLAQAMGVG